MRRPILDLAVILSTPPVVASTRYTLLGRKPRHRYQGTDDERGTHPGLDAELLTLMTARSQAGSGAAVDAWWVEGWRA